MAIDATHKGSGMGRELAVYIVLLVLAAIQFFIAYQNISPKQMFTSMLCVALIEAAIALLFFMHLSENRGLMWFVVIFTVAVLLGLQYGWTDSFRMDNGVPWSHTQ
jgi:heme/copper-type cytochrome/quinol oxidase subunit 4